MIKAGIRDGSSVWVNNSYIGYVESWVNNSNADACFIITTSSYNPTNENTYSREFKGTGPCIEGQFIRMDGKASGNKFGYIEALGKTATSQTNLVRATYDAQGGDSGLNLSQVITF